MKNQPSAKSGIALVFLSFVLAIMAISAIESVLFYQKFRHVDTLEALHNSINRTSAVVARLGNTLDIVVVGQRFEQTTINILRNDVNRINKDITKLLERYRKDKFITSNKILADELKGVPGEWQKIYQDIMKFRANMSRDEVMLIHNDVDVDILVLDEKFDRVSTGINSLLKRVFSEIKMLLMTTLGAFILMLTVAAVFIYQRFISPMYKLEVNALALSSGSGRKRFMTTLSGIAGSVARELNTILEESDRHAAELGEKIAGLDKRLMEKELAIKTLSEFFQASGRTFNMGVLMNESLKKLPPMTGALGALVYLRNDDEVRLVASAWGQDGARDGLFEMLTVDSLGMADGRMIETNSVGAPEYAAIFREKGINFVQSFAISPDDNHDYGRLMLLFSEPPGEYRGGFTRALVSAMGTSIAFSTRLAEEHESREKSLALINQLPMGLAVFDREGRCITANLILKKFLGAGPDFEFLQNYTYREDDILEAQGLVTTINKAYDGFVTEFIINYDPYLVKRYGFMGQTRDLRVKSVPLFEPDGTINKISLIYEDITLIDDFTVIEENRHR